MSDSLGKLFVVTSFGESHGRGIGAIVAGCPAGLHLTLDDIQSEVDKRRPAGAAGSTARREDDRVEILSGLFDGRTTGAPICLMVGNKDTDSSAYDAMRLTPRPGHADYTAYVKYGGFNDYRGGGRFSGRLTAGFVMAGAVAKKVLEGLGIKVMAHTVAIAGIHASEQSIDAVRDNPAKNAVKCADPEAALSMERSIEEARQRGDSVGGTVEGIVLNVPPGIGEPLFDTLEGEMAKALFAIPAVKGVEFGAGFSAALNTGSQNNDPFLISNGRVLTSTNKSGGILGGISNGMPIVVRVAFKPTPSISIPQKTVNLGAMSQAELSIKGRHDSCIVPRAVPVVESMIAITLADLALRAGVIPRVIK